MEKEKAKTFLIFFLLGVVVLVVGFLMFNNSENKINANVIENPENIEEVDEEINFEIDSEYIEKVKDEMFNLMNFEREKKDIVKLIRSYQLEEIAQEYSQKMLEDDFFAHTDSDEKDVYDRLQGKNIFYWTAIEDLSLNSVYSDTNLSEEVVYDWIDSPGHRVPIIDVDKPVTWDNIGLGVSCKKDEENNSYICYSVAVFAGLSSESINEKLENGYVQYVDLYPEDFGFEYESIAHISFNSSRTSRLLITSDSDNFDKYIGGDELKGDIWTHSSVKNFEKTLKIYPGYNLLIYANGGDIKYNLSIKYN
jgi:uncharacterized protein YkwD